MDLNVPYTVFKRVVIIGGGFAGIVLAKSLIKSDLQIVLLDRNNFHQFQPLLYQVATSGLEPTAISFPFRKLFAKRHNFFFRMCEVLELIPSDKRVSTSIGDLSYDYLVLAAGTNTNYFGLEKIAQSVFSLKSVHDAIRIRNHLLNKMEQVVLTENRVKADEMLSIVIVGGGATGVELAGALAELRNTVFPDDYPQLDLAKMSICLINASSRLLESFHPVSSQKAYNNLVDLGVKILLNTAVTDYSDGVVTCSDGMTLRSQTVVWVSGVIANCFKGIDGSLLGKGQRIKVDSMNRIECYDGVFVIGDMALMTSDDYPNGHPQVAQVAIQQGRHLAKNLKLMAQKKEPMIAFKYLDKGSMATIGRNRAVAELKGFHFSGFIAWALWLFVHLLYIIGAHNKATIILDWAWSYLSYDRPVRTIIEEK